MSKTQAKAEQAIADSLGGGDELRDQAAKDQIEHHRLAMRRIGVRPGDGIPMWALYMTRRNKRSWG